MGAFTDLLLHWGGVMSLYDLLEVYADRYVQIGAALESIASDGDRQVTQNPHATMNAQDIATFIGQLTSLKTHCEQLDLGTSGELIEQTIGHLRESSLQRVAVAWVSMMNGVDFLRRAFQAELKKRTFLALPSVRAHYYPALIAGAASIKFPLAVHDMTDACRCLALGCDTACVFHLMRVLEHGLVALADTLAVQSEFENWKNIIDQIEAEIKKLEQQPKSQQKSDDLQFYSEAAKEFRYFKDAWRNHVAHSRADYDFTEAHKIMEHVKDFMVHLATRLSGRPR